MLLLVGFKNSQSYNYGYVIVMEISSYKLQALLCSCNCNFRSVFTSLRVSLHRFQASPAQDNAAVLRVRQDVRPAESAEAAHEDAHRREAARLRRLQEGILHLVQPQHPQVE